MKFILIFSLILYSFNVFAQDELSNYLKLHNYPFSLDEGFNKSVSDTLRKKLSSYKLIIQAEGGSHSLTIYKKLPLIWIKFLNANFGMTHFFLESSPSYEVIISKYLQFGDTSLLLPKTREFWKTIRLINSKLPDDRKVNYFGIDFNRPWPYIKALKMILPNNPPQEKIKSIVELIRNADDTLNDCDYILNINSKIKKLLKRNKADFIQYLGDSYAEFERIILVKGTCHDVLKNRNGNMATNFLSYVNKLNDSIYYGELGEAHTILKFRNTASIINNSPTFKDKVCVINLYCYNCTSKETIFNWPLKKIEKDILQYFIPLSTSDLTLFDLSENNKMTERFKSLGQFLIIAKNQN